MSSFDVFVIGAGVAGLTAAGRAARRGLAVGMAEASMFGGLIMNVNHLKPGVEGLPAAGSDVAAELMNEVADLGVETLFENVQGIARADDGTFTLTLDGGTHTARTVIVASGAQLRKLGVPGEAQFEGRGVAHCADCDAPMYRGEVAVVVGGGDSALQEALVLAEFCRAVHVVHRKVRFSARPSFVDSVRNLSRIQLHMGTAVEAIVGEQAVTAVRVRNEATGLSIDLACKGVFAYVGLEPNTAFLPPAVELVGGAVRVNAEMESTLAGVFAVGAVRASYGGQLADAVHDAGVAVEAVWRRLGRA